MKATPFELRVIPRPDRGYGVALFEYQRNGTRSDAEPQRVVQIWGTPLEAIAAFVLDSIKQHGYKGTDLRRDRTAPFKLTEESGVRLGLLMMGVKPLRKLSRLDAIARAVRNMGAEEAYYWFSKCANTRIGRRAQRAFRILLAQE